MKLSISSESLYGQIENLGKLVSSFVNPFKFLELGVILFSYLKVILLGQQGKFT